MMMTTIQMLLASVDMINTANGWRTGGGEAITARLPVAQIASLTPLSIVQAKVIESIRDGDQNGQVQALAELATEYEHFGSDELKGYTWSYLMDLEENHVPLHGSKVQALARLRLIDTETAEASEAVLKGDTANLGEELADIVIRVMDFVGAWNEAHPDQPIDLEAAILAKLEKNQARGYRHGGKLA